MAACSPWEIAVTQNREWITHGNGGLEHMRHLQRMAENAGLKTAFYYLYRLGRRALCRG